MRLLQDSSLIVLDLVQLVLHVGDGVSVKLGLDLSALLKDVEVAKELVKAKNTLLEVIHAHTAVRVEVKPHPSAVDGH